jgi:epoxyqueuosine reductase
LILVADQYAAPGSADQPATATSEPTGRVARYARGRDYHVVMRKRLHTLADALRTRHPGHEFRSFVDTGPVLEREHAARAGLGFIGKHTLLIDPRPGGAGSYMLLGGIATSLAIEPSVDARPESPAPELESFCGHCMRCIDACPTGAIEPYRVDARKCISYLTIEHEGPIDAIFHTPMGDWIFGCDVCQEVCPYNQPHREPTSGTAAGARIHPLYREREGLAGGRVPLRTVLGWTAADRQVALTVSAGKRASRSMMRRNAVIAAGNATGRDAALDEAVRQIAASDPDDTVRTTAQQVLRPPDPHTPNSRPA